MVAGQVLTAAGHGRGYVTVELRPGDGGNPQRTVSEESGDFLFDEVPPGEYSLHVLIDTTMHERNKGTELESDNPMVHLSSGQTLTQNVVLK